MSRVAFLPFVVDGGDENWTEQALCREVDPEVFYPERGESSAAARLICGRCSVRTACLEGALDAGEPYGFWGGKSTVERRQILKARRAQTLPGAA